MTPVAYVLLGEEGDASAHVVLGKRPFAHRSGPERTSLEDALEWARAAAPRVALQTVDGRWSAGTEPHEGLPAWSPERRTSSDWPAITPPYADGWRATLGLGLDVHDSDFLERLANVLGGTIRSVRRHEVTFDVAGGPRDEQQGDAENAVDEAWQQTVAQLEREPELSVSSLELDPLGACVPARPSLALITSFDESPDGRRRWTIRFHEEESERPDAPYMAPFEECLRYGRARAEVVLARVVPSRGFGAPYVDATRGAPT